MRSYLWSHYHVIMVAILLVAGAIRFHGLVWSLPYLLDGDEWRVVNTGLSLYYLPDTESSPGFFLESYPPYRIWEVLFSRIFLTITQGDALDTTMQTLLGRVFSVLYGVLTTALVYRLAFQLTKSSRTGLIAAAFFATWSATMRYHQLALADGPALMFFVAALWFSVVAYRCHSKPMLVAAVVAGILATIAKYNMIFALFIPVALIVRALFRDFWGTARVLIFPLASILVILGSLLMHTFSFDNLRCYVERESFASCYENGPLPLTDQAIATDGVLVDEILFNLKQSAARFFMYLPVSVFLLALGGLLSVASLRGLNILDRLEFLPGADRRMLLALAVLGFVIFFGLCAIRIQPARQLLGSMVIAIIFFAIFISLLLALAALYRPAQIVLLALIFVGFVVLGLNTWDQNSIRYLPDSRVATVEWFARNAPSGAGIISEAPLYEFGRLNGFQSDKVFRADAIAASVYTVSVETMKCMGYDYLVADAEVARPDEFNDSPVLPEDFARKVAVMATFHPPEFAGPRRTIFYINSDCPTGETFQ